MVAESALSPTISATGSPGTTFRRRKATTRTPNSVGIVASRRLATSFNTDFGPALAVENHRDIPAFDRGMLRPEVNGKPEVEPRSGVIDARVDATIQRLARRLTHGAARHHDQRVGDAIAVERVVPAGPNARAVKQRVEEVVGIRIVGPPVGDRHVGVALPDGFAHARGVARRSEEHT